jgi:hypothetical protein
MASIEDVLDRIERDVQMARRLLEEDPRSRYTGCRLARGTHGRSYRHEILGTDVPPPDWPHPKPTRGEIERALAEQAAA